MTAISLSATRLGGLSHPAAADDIRGDLPRQVARFVLLGGVSTLLQIVLYAALRHVTGTTVATVVSLILSTVANTWANRLYTFEVADRNHVTATHGLGLGLTCLTGIAQWCAAQALAGTSVTGLAEATIVGLAGASLGVVRFVSLRTWFRRSQAL